MSATGKRMKRDEADLIARTVVNDIIGEALAVGSIRRRAAEVGDIEIALHVNAVVALPIGVGPLLPGAFETIKGGGKRWRYWQLRNVAEGFVIDLWRFDDLNRGSITLMRTGPENFSYRFVMALRRRGLRHHEGYVRNLAGEAIVPCPTEQDAFFLAGMQWIEPEDRR